MTTPDPTTLRSASQPKPTAEPSGAAQSATPTTTLLLNEETRLELVEEQLEAHPRLMLIGEVLIRKEVVTETRTIQVPIRREELVVERRAVEHRPADQPNALESDDFERALAARFRGLQQGESIRLPLLEEEVVVEKRPVVYEEVLIGKRAYQDIQAVSGTVRREELRVDRQGDVDVSHVRRGDPQPGVSSGIST